MSSCSTVQIKSARYVFLVVGLFVCLFFHLKSQHEMKSALNRGVDKNFEGIFLGLLTGCLVPTLVFISYLKEINLG